MAHGEKESSPSSARYPQPSGACPVPRFAHCYVDKARLKAVSCPPLSSDRKLALKRNQHETHLSAQRLEAQAHPRISRSHAHAGRPGRHQGASRQRPLASERLNTCPSPASGSRVAKGYPSRPSMRRLREANVERVIVISGCKAGRMEWFMPGLAFRCRGGFRLKRLSETGSSDKYETRFAYTRQRSVELM